MKHKIILYVGYLDREKGFFDLLEVFLKISKEKLDLVLFAVGDVSQENRKRIEEVLKKEKSEEKVRYVGFVSDKQQLIQYYKNADLFVFPSLFEESFGQTWAQALACGTPVIAYGTGSVSELLGQHGILIQTGNRQKLEKAIEDFFNKQEQKNGKQQEARKAYAKNMFSIENAMPLLGQVYKDINYSELL